MCKGSKKTPIANDNAPAGTRSPAHRLAALAALTLELDQIDQLRETLDERREAYAAKLGTIEEAIAQMESRVADEADALAAFTDEYECDCGCAGGEPVHASAYDDEEIEPEAERSQPAEPVSSRGPAGTMSTLFGALGVAFAVASLVFRSDASRGGE
jgi:hypothetical protein